MNRIYNRRAFTLMEALFATLVLGIGLFVVGAAFYGQRAVIDKLGETTVATLAAQEEIEKIRGLQFDTVAGINSSWVSNNPPSAFSYLLKNKNPTCTIVIGPSYGNDIKNVTVTISWRSLSGQSLSKSIATLVARYGINKQ